MLPHAGFSLLAVSLLSFFCNYAMARTIIVHTGQSIRAALARG
jgi:hypothetical protein